MPWPSDPPDEYFAQRGYLLEVHVDGEHGDLSADLVSTGGRVVRARYGSGGTDNEARVSALRRWHVEEEPDPPLPYRLP